MNHPPVDALIAGHICLDIIPSFPKESTAHSLSDFLIPGRLTEVSDAVLATGGATSNTGLAMHRLGFTVGIIGKVGDDHFGSIIRAILQQHGQHLADSMIIGRGEGSSYTIVINPPGVDRIFLHNAGANNTFLADEVTDESLSGARLIHFGYPPLMRGFFSDNGRELKKLFSRARERGLATSLDMARPDPDGESGRVDWGVYLRETLPFVDVFLPSIDEILFMVDRPLFNELSTRAGEGNIASLLDIERVRGLADLLLGMGPAVIGFKLGDEGFYVKTSSDPGRFSAMGRGAPADIGLWAGREYVSGCRKVCVVGTTGAGDCTIAGFLGGLLRGLDVDGAVAMAVAVGGASVEARDSVSGVPSWGAVVGRLADGWESAGCGIMPEGWERTPAGNWRS